MNQEKVNPSHPAISKSLLLRIIVSGLISIALMVSMSPSASASGANAAPALQIQNHEISQEHQRILVSWQPDIGEKPSFLSDAEWDAYVRKMRGQPYDKSLYKSAKRKFDKKAKEEGRRNAQKRANKNNHPNKHAYVVKARWNSKEVISFVVVVAGTLAIGAIFSGAGFVFAVMQTKTM